MSKMVSGSWSTSGSTGDKLLTGRSDELRDTGLIVLRRPLLFGEEPAKQWELGDVPEEGDGVGPDKAR